MTAPTSHEHAARDRRVELLFQEHAEAVLRRIRRVDPSLAEDVVSETFAVALRRHADIPAGAELPWLFVVADNLLRNQQRGRRRATNLTAALGAHAPQSAAPADLPVVGPALQTLPDRERALLTMTGFEGLTAVEAADRLGMPAGSARNAMVRGRRQLASTLAALGVVVASVVFAFVFAHQDRSGAQAGESVADSIRGATTIFNVARVHASGDRDATQYRVYTDTHARRERITLPGGLVASSERGEPLHVVTQRGQSRATVRAAQRRLAADLAALDAASPTEIARFLSRDVRGRTTSAGPTLAGRETALVRGGIVDRAGKRRELQLYITTVRPQVLRVRTRLRGARAWATIDFVKWEMVPRPPRAAGSPADQGTAGPTTPSGPRPPALVPDASPGDGASSADPRDRKRSRGRGGDDTSVAAEPESDAGQTAHRASSAVRLPEPYSGPVGTVLHTRSVEAGRASESWHELGGGERWVATVEEPRRAPNPDGSVFRLTLWSSVAVEMVGDNYGATAYLSCTPGRRAGYVSPPQDDELLLARFAWIGERLAAGDPLPEGPVIDGHPTVAVDLPPTATLTGRLRLVADRSSGVPKQVITVTPSGVTRVVDYALWEVLSAEAAAKAPLAQPGPGHVKVRRICTEG